MMQNDYLIKVDNISFQRERKLILSDISFTLRAREHLAIIGPNGSGKTTLIKILSGLEWPSAGQVHFAGESEAAPDIRDIRRRTHLVSQAGKKMINSWQKAIDIVTSGIDNSYGIYHPYPPSARAAALLAMEQANCHDCLNKTFDILSEGQQQRVMIARALISKPAVLILDEPCNGLDPWARKKLTGDIQQLSERSDAPAIIYVTHYMEEIYPYINHVLALKAGRVFAWAKPQEILKPELLDRLFEPGD